MISEQTRNIVDMLSEKRNGDQLESISMKESESSIQEIEFVFQPKEKDCKRFVSIAGKDLIIGFGTESLQSG